MPTSQRSLQALPTDHDNGNEWLEVTPGERFMIRVPSNATGGAYVVLELVAEPCNGVPMHVHDDEEEHFIIVEGTARMANGSKTLDVTAGSAVTVNKGIPHAWCNRTDAPLRMLVIFTPGRIKGLFRAIAANKGEDDVIAIANAYGTRMIGPPLRDGIYTALTPRPRSA
jgi:mannose-6-phosphate isomerase-like protein (cupin superfamily)